MDDKMNKFQKYILKSSTGKVNANGFSLVELIIVIAIIIIVAAVGIPAMMPMLKSMNVNGAATTIATDLQWARMKAVSESNNYVVAFGANNKVLTNNTYYIYDDNNNDFSSTGPGTATLIKTIVLPDIYSGIIFGYVAGIKETNNTDDLTGEAVTFNSGGANAPIRVTFRPIGTPSLNGTIYLIPQTDLADSVTNRMRAITIITTGRVKVWKYAGGAWE